MKTLKDFIKEQYTRAEVADNHFPGHMILNDHNLLYEYIFGSEEFKSTRYYDIEQINEALTMTYDPYKAKRIICDYFKKDFERDILILETQDINDFNDIIDRYHIKYDKNKEQFFYLKYRWYTGRETKDAVKDAMRFFGYYFSHEYEYKPNNFWLYFYPKHQVKMNERIRRENKYLYHLTTREIAEKIKKDGFVPKSTNNVYEYPGRIHLIMESASKETKLSLIEQLKKEDKYIPSDEKDNRVKNPKLLDFVEIKIDVKKLPMNMNFYTDPDFSKFGVFTYDNIKPNTIVDIYDIKEEKN